MRIGEGIIDELLDDGLAKVKVNSDQLYVACSACIAADHVFVTAYNDIGAQEGQLVRYEVEDRHLVSSAFIFFIVPLIVALIFGFLGYEGGIFAGYDGYAITIVGAVIGILISGIIMKTYDRSLGKIMDTKATITEIIVDEDEAEA